MLKDVEVEWKELGEVANLSGGYTPKRSNSNYWENGDIPWFTLKDIRKFGNDLTKSIETVTQEAISSGLFPKDSLILSTTATIGERAIVRVPFICNQQLTSITPVESVDLLYLYHYFGNIKDELLNKSSASGSVNIINQTNLKKIKIPVPSLEIQKEIAKTLTFSQNMLLNYRPNYRTVLSNTDTIVIYYLVNNT